MGQMEIGENSIKATEKDETTNHPTLYRATAEWHDRPERKRGEIMAYGQRFMHFLNINCLL